MRYLCNLKVYITVEAATLIGLTFVAATSYVYRSVMARKKKSGAPKPPQSTGSTSSPPKAVTAPKGADVKSFAQSRPAAIAAPVIQEVDTRPETSPYGSPACTIPFASPLTVPLDILKKSPKLQAAYESRLPELPTIPEDVGHVLVHYLHTGTYESLKPKPTDTMSRQICELKTSIQSYAAARAYDLPDLMRLAEAKIDKYGEGLPLPALLEVARDAYPTLTEGDAWFLDYLRSKIRPHLKDPKSLLGSNLLDQISGILSPHKVLLRTVLELFCERIVVRSEPTTSPNPSTIASPISSPGTSRPVSPPRPASPMSLLEMRSRSIAKDDSPPPRKTLKATPWPSPDIMSEASWARETSPEPILREIVPPHFEAKPMPVLVPMPALAPFQELGPVILDVVPPPGPAIKAVPEPQVKVLPEPKPIIAVEPEKKVEVELADKPVPKPEAKIVVEPEITPAPEPEAKIAVENEKEPAVEAELEVQTKPEPKVDFEPTKKTDTEPRAKDDEVEGKATAKSETKSASGPKEPETEPAVEPKNKGSGGHELGQEEPVQDSLSATQRERKDSGKGIDLQPFRKELESAPEPMPELEIESKPQLQVQRRVLREADSGFWEGPDLEPGKEPATSVVELEPMVLQVPLPVPALAPLHELDVGSDNTSEIPTIAIRDFAEVDGETKNDAEKSDNEKKTDAEDKADTEIELKKQTAPVPSPAEESVPETATETLPNVEAESESKPEPLPTKSVEEIPDKAASATTLVPEITPAEVLPEKAQSKEDEAQPETEKVQEKTIEPEALAEPEPEPKADSSEPVHLPDDAQPTRAPEAKAAQPRVEPGPKPVGKTEVQGDPAHAQAAVNPAAASRTSLAKSPAVLSAKPAPEYHEGPKTEADTAAAQPCGGQVRQKSWKKRFLSLRYPVLFGRGM
ncbi:hypothetical protein VTI74DRAFT_10336 [Chaetomium olivicolor]